MKGSKTTTKELQARAERNGYKRGAHKEEDRIRDLNKHVDKTMSNHESILNRYVA